MFSHVMTFVGGGGVGGGGRKSEEAGEREKKKRKKKGDGLPRALNPSKDIPLPFLILHQDR